MRVAAIRCAARRIVTGNLADVPARVLEGFAIKVIDADEFLA